MSYRFEEPDNRYTGPDSRDEDERIRDERAERRYTGPKRRSTDAPDLVALAVLSSLEELLKKANSPEEIWRLRTRLHSIERRASELVDDASARHAALVEEFKPAAGF